MAVAERLQSRIFSGMDSADAWNEVSVDLIRCAKVNLADRFYKELKRNEYEIGPLNDLVTWCNITHAGTQVARWDFQNKAIRTSPP